MYTAEFLFILNELTTTRTNRIYFSEINKLECKKVEGQKGICDKGVKHSHELAKFLPNGIEGKHYFDNIHE
jgi:hypothetical protein